MANGINRVTLIGNLGRDPEIQRLESGVKKATFSLATTETYKNKEGARVDHTEWHNIVLWRALAEVAENYLKKGNQVYIEGKIRKREYEDKDGQKKFIYEIIADNMQMLGGKPGGSGESRPPADSPDNGNTGNGDVTPLPEDDLPF